MAMEIFTGVVMKTCPGLYSGPGIDPLLRVYVRKPKNYAASKIFTRSLTRRVVGETFAFDDKRHMEYYNCCTEEREEEKKKKSKKKTTENCGWNSVLEKKRAKLVKDLTKSLNMLSELGFGLETDDDKVKTISEAALVLQAHLEHLGEEGKKKKLEKKGEMAELVAGHMTSVMDDSSSSSSESSDSECDNDGTAYISMLRNKMAAEQDESMRSQSMATPPTSVAEAKEIEGVSMQVERVEVCMGGKCKKAGAPVLIEEFKNMLGVGGSVVGCKCMGKCKTAPNVRVFNGGAGGEEEDEDDSVRSPRNPLFLGVGLDDVSFIVANYLGSQSEQTQASHLDSAPSLS